METWEIVALLSIMIGGLALTCVFMMLADASFGCFVGGLVCWAVGVVSVITFTVMSYNQDLSPHMGWSNVFCVIYLIGTMAMLLWTWEKVINLG